MTLDKEPKVTAMTPRNASIATLSAGILTVLGSFMPWARVLFLQVNGTDGDGVLTALLGVAIAVCGFVMLRNPTRAAPIVAVLCALAALAIVVYDGFNLSGPGVSLGIGLYLTGIGASAAFIVTVLVLSGQTVDRGPAARVG